MSNTLGKISAILSLNTAQFQRGCNESARDVRNFAGTIERNIRRASDSAQKSLGNILTPLQQLQASMRAAFDQRLSFQGFQGAIRDVEDLKRRLGSLSGRDIALTLNISGEEHITDLQQKLREISNRDIRILLRVGGEGGIDAGVRRLTQIRDELTQDKGFETLQNQIAGVTAKLNELNAASQTIKIGPKGGGMAELAANRQEAELLTRTLAELQQQRQRIVSQRVGINIDFTELDELIAKSGRVDLTRVPTLIDRLGASQQGQSETRLTRLTALAEGISRPLEAAVAEFAKLDMAVQAGFMPTLSAAQNETMALGNALRTAGDYGDDAFNRVERQVDQTIIAIRQMKELSDSVSGLKTGNEMVFQQPDLMASLASARKFGDRAAEAMPSLNPADRAEMIARIQLMSELAEQISIVHASMKDSQLRGLTLVAAGSQQDLEEMRQQLIALQAEGERVIPIKVDTVEAKAKIDPIAEQLQRIRELADFSFTGRVQSFQQAQSEVTQILAAYDRLDEASKAKVGPAVTTMAANFTAGAGFFDADEIRKVSALVDEEGKATRAAGDLRAAMDRIADGINPSKPIDALRKNLDQARASVAKLKDEQQKAAGERQIAAIGRYLRASPDQRRDRATDEQAIARASAAAARVSATYGTPETEKPVDRAAEFARQTAAADAAIASQRATVQQAQAERDALVAKRSQQRQQQDMIKRRRAVAAAAVSGQQAMLRRMAGGGAVTASQFEMPLSKNLDELISRIETQQASGEGTMRFARPDWRQALRTAYADEEASMFEMTARTKYRGDFGRMADWLGDGTGIGPAIAIDRNVDQYSQTNVAKAVERLRALREELARLKAEAKVEPTVNTSQIESAAAKVRDAETELNRLNSQRASMVSPAATDRMQAARKLLGTDQSATVLPRELELVGGRVNSLRGQIDSLPIGLRSQMIPTLRSIQAEFVRLAGQGRASAAEIQRMEQGLRRAEAQAKRFATANSLMGARDAIGGIRTNEATGRLAAMQRVLVQVGATASGPVARAYERFLTATQRAIRENTIGLPRIKRQLDGLAEGVARAASQTGRISFNKANREIQRGGDVGRMGFDKFSLGIQQAGFAVDDFFSSVGGWDQKIRAISNNITQMAFIMGGTYGLGAGLAFVIGSQIALAVNKFVFKSREAEAAASAMNKALDNQKDRVKELADSYRTLAVEISKSGMTKEGARRFEQQQAIRDRRKEGNEVAIEIAAGRSPRLAAARGMVEFERKNRSEATNVRDVLRAAARERAAEVVVRRREEAMLAKARETAGGSSYDRIRADQIRNKERLDRAQKIDDNDVLGGIWWVTEPRRAARRRRIAAMQEKDAALEAAASLRRQQKGEALLAAGGGVESRLAPITQRLDEIGFTRAGQRINELFQSIASAMEDFQAGRMTEESLKAFIDSLGATASAAEAAAQPVLAFAETVKRLGSDAVRAGAETARSKEEELRRDANSAVGSSQRGTDLMRSQARSRADEARAGEQRIAAARREAEAGLYQIRQEQAAMQARFEADIAAGGGPAEAVDISRRIAAQNAILTAPASSPELQEQTRLYIERLQERLRQIIEAMPESQELRARADGLLAGLDGVISAVEESRRRAEEEAAFDREVANRRNPVGNAMRGLDLSESPAERAAREARQGFADIVANYDRQFEELGDRNNGRSFAGQDAEAANLRANRQAAIQRFVNDQMRSAAPAIFEMADAVANAVLQGPSRQALEVSDVSTMEGSKELNRLLRGDDASKNANIVELQKQNQTLTEVRDQLKDVAQKLGIVVNL